MSNVVVFENMAAQQQVREREEHGRKPPRRRSARSYEVAAEATIAGFCALQAKIPHIDDTNVQDSRGRHRYLKATCVRVGRGSGLSRWVHPGPKEPPKNTANVPLALGVVRHRRELRPSVTVDQRKRGPERKARRKEPFMPISLLEGPTRNHTLRQGAAV
jgi:hypothetical protein